MIYKLTDANGQTYNATQWGEGVEHTAPGGGEICSSAYLHAYLSPLLAVLMDPVHAAFGESARLWECDGDVEIDDGTKLGCTRLRSVREIPLPEVTTEQRVRFAILCAQRVIGDGCPDWSSWAMAAKWAAEWGAAKWAAEAAEWAAEAAEWGAAERAGARAGADLDLVAIAEEACL